MKKLKFILLALSFAFFITKLSAQTNPFPHVLYNSSFEFTGFEDGSSLEYPTSIQGWRGPVQVVTPPAQPPTATQATGDQPIMGPHGTCCIGYYNYGSNGIGMDLFQNTQQCFAVVLSINTKATHQNTLYYSGGVNTPEVGSVPCAVSLQYRIGTKGDWTNTDTMYSFGSTDVAAMKNIVFPIPAALEDKEVVQFRWLLYYMNPGAQTFTDWLQLDEIMVKTEQKDQLPAPVANFGFMVTDSLVSFTDSSLNLPHTWKWDFGDGNTSPAQNPEHVYEAPGEYNVKLVITNATASDSIAKLVQIIDTTASGIRSAMVSALKVYPNPAGTELVINYPAKNTVEAELINPLGKQVMKMELINGANRIDVSTLPSSIYIIKLQDGKEIVTQCLQVIH